MKKFILFFIFLFFNFQSAQAICAKKTGVSCGVIACTYATSKTVTQTTCLANANCSWNPSATTYKCTTKTAEARCAEKTTATSCTGNSCCNWTTTTSCKRSTINAFTTCKSTLTSSTCETAATPWCIYDTTKKICRNKVTTELNNTCTKVGTTCPAPVCVK